MPENPPTTPLRSSQGPLSSEWGRLLYEISRQLSTTLELDEALSKVLTLTLQAAQGSQGSIFLLDDDGSVLRSITARQDQPVEIRNADLSDVMTRGFAGWMYRYRKGDIVFDTHTDERWYDLSGDSALARSAMGTPLIRRNRIIALITLTHPDPHWFTPRHLTMLEIIAAQAASIIESAAAYTQMNNERLRLRAVIAGVQDFILVTDLENNLILANPAARQRLGFTESEYGKPMQEIIEDPAVLALFQAGGVDECMPNEVTLRDGQIFNFRLVEIPTVGRMLALHDITTFKQLDALKTQFVSHVSHDLKAPLAVMQGYLWLIEKTAAASLGAEFQGYIREMFGSIDRMRGLIDGILDLGKIEMGIEVEFRPIALNEVAYKAVEHLRPLAQKGNVALEVGALSEEVQVRGSPLRLEQAVSNLVGNAIKFTPGGGSVRVSVARENGQAIVRVKDSGPGIPPAMQEKLFQKFSRLGLSTTQEREGHGLGLAIVKSIVEAHRGRVWVESEVGKGSTFVFAVPIYVPEV